MSMGKNKRSPLTQAVSKPMDMPSMPPRPDKVTVTKAANGGYIVRKSGGKTSEYDAEDEVYKGLSGVKKCMKEHFADKGEESEEEA